MIQLVTNYQAADRERLLIAAVREGDAFAFEEIHREMLPFARASARACLRNEADVEDVAHHAMLRLYHSLARFRGDCSLKTWTFKIARNLAMNRSYSNKRRRVDATVSLDLTPEGLDAALHDVIPDEAEGAREEIETAEYAELVAKARLKLAEDHQEIIALRVDLKMEYLQIADFLSIKVGTVKSRLTRARGALRDLLK